MTIVSTNFSSSFVYQAVANINKNDARMSATVAKLSSGLRLTTAAEDPAGIYLSNKFESQMRGVRQAINNTEDALNMVRFASDALTVASSMLLRMRDLAVRALSTATLTASDYNAIQNEFNGLRTELMRQARSVSYNGKVLLSVAMTNQGFAQIGPDNGAKYRLCYKMGIPSQILFMQALTNLLRVKMLSGRAGSAHKAISNAMKQCDTMANAMGVMERKINSIINDLMSQELNLAGITSRIKDADMAAEISEFTRLQIVNQASTAVLAQGNDIAKKANILLEDVMGASPF